MNPYQTTGANTAGRLAISYTGDLDNSGNPMCTVITQSGVDLKQAFVDDYTYTSAELINGKGLHMITIKGTGAVNVQDFRSTSTYNSEGSLLTLKYPDMIRVDGTVSTNHTVSYTYDGMNRPSMYSSDRFNDNFDHLPNDYNNVLGVSYNAANQPTLTNFSVNGPVSASPETRAYNALNQLTSINSGGGSVVTYNYTAGADNGQIASMVDSAANRTVTYAYDALKRLTGATATGAGPWGQSFGYDGFGNLYSKTITSGAAQPWSVTIDPATNHVNGYHYDGNGNLQGDTQSNFTSLLSKTA